ncbi:DNA-binding response regulator [Streptomyces alkaliphilus]|uniref:DNA-binding response regulator n=1 Tax=Streptomyces alkaliphilus TaxID=1472722 RepID=UPI0034D1C0E2
MERIRVLVVDRHRVFAESLAMALTAEPDVEAAATGGAAAADRLVERAREIGDPLRVLLVDAGAEGAEDAGTALAARIGAWRARQPRLHVVVLAAEDDPRACARLLSAGARGWVAKDCSLARLLQVVRGVVREETHLSPGLLTGVLAELTRETLHRSEHERLVEALTPRELEVLRCMLAGLGRKAVAERLYLSPHTVRTHMQNVLGKLGVHSTLAAVALARRAGVPPAD